jgi:putative phosphoesterase
MKRILLLSDTHGFLDPRVLPYLEHIDEIWHAGDIGNKEILNTLSTYAPVKSVWGNIDDHQVRSLVPEWLEWNTESVHVLMTHIGGRPPKFAPGIKNQLIEKKPTIFICGHSHILLVQYLPELKCLHLNPGACGKSGWHKVQTMLRFIIDETNIRNMEVIELKRLPSL